MQGRLALNIIVSQGTPVFQLFSSEDEALLVRWNALLVLDLRLDVFDCVTALNFEGDCFAGECFYEDLHDGFLCVYSFDMG